MLTNHILAIRARPRLRLAIINVYIEGNFGGDYGSSRIQDIVENPRLAPVRVYTERRHNEERPGFIQTKSLKFAAADSLKEVLKQGNIHFASDDDFVCFGTPEETRQRILKQLSDFRLERKEDKNNPWVEKKETLSGKKFGPDDHATTICQDVEMIKRERANPQFLTMCRRNGWDPGL